MAMRKFSEIHELKLDAMEDMLEELNGEPLLVAYEFQSDFERIRERFGALDHKTGRKVLPYLGKGTSAADEDRWIKQWNRGELPLLCAHPASAGHGLNMQGASACNVAWFGIPWDYELWDQFIRRIRRDGTKALQIFNHLFIVKGTIDELKLLALAGKDLTQSGLMRALNAEIRRDADTPATGDHVAHRRNDDMVAKLTRPAPAGQQTAQPEPDRQVNANVVMPKGWANRGAQTDVEDVAPSNQRERIQEVIAPQDNAQPEQANTRSAFGRRVQEAAQDIQNQGQDVAQDTSNGVRTDQPHPVKAPRTRAARGSSEAAKSATEPTAAVPNIADIAAILIEAAGVNSASAARLTAARVEVLKIAFADPAYTLEEGLELADDLWKWAEKPF